MFDHLKAYNIYIKSGFADMRKRAGNLSLLVRSEMDMDPIENHREDYISKINTVKVSFGLVLSNSDCC